MSEEEKTPAREVITDYAQSHFRYFRTADGTVYAQRNGHPVARPIRSQGTTGSHRQELMVGLFHDGLGVFNGTAMKEALDLIEALALTEAVQPVHIRVAPGLDGATWLDLGRDDGQSVRIHPTGWEITVPDPREVCWRRTQLTGELPLPDKDTNEQGIDHLTALDNLSHMTPDLSDAMCCIVTGAENVKRALFTDGDVFRARYRRPLLLTGIDVGAIRPDLAERLLPLRLERPRVRRTEAELWAEYERVLPVILGSLLDLTVKVRAVRAQTPTDLRMADFAHLCAQLDTATGLGALPAYRASLDDLNDDVIEGDLLAQTGLKHAESIPPGTEQRMTSTEWLHLLSRLYSGEELRPLPKGWPTTGKVLSDRLKRLQPTLAARGVLIDSVRTSEGRYLEMARRSATTPHEQNPAF
ncbi:ATP-binding protein [Streptomyces sp. NEAU-H3]|uniref:ATP-binding protein n=1 Tax=Streptomyces sp. NEAU-H3 TaxID=2720636 RepID=UPI001438947A|nr:ATP-binding protein [Streptomyces sp. NEAU-H3]NJA56265.1 ATP-binding protein [Streptomyces sp. NEAU-H3]